MTEEKFYPVLAELHELYRFPDNLVILQQKTSFWFELSKALFTLAKANG